MASTPRALLTEQTTRFLRAVLKGRRRVLEVGCGRGDVARALAAAGHEVTALDQHLRDLPDRHPAPGLAFVEHDFLSFESAPFDAVVFTASLHHIAPLDRAVERAAALTAPGGLVVVDDFDLDAPDVETLRWYYELQELLVVAGAYPAERVDPPRPDPVTRWRDAHRHDPPLHTGAQVRRALGERLAIRERRRCEYLYRYVCGGLAGDDRGAALAAHVHATERRRIAEGCLVPVGLQILADRA